MFLTSEALLGAVISTTTVVYDHVSRLHKITDGENYFYLFLKGFIALVDLLGILFIHRNFTIFY